MTTTTTTPPSSSTPPPEAAAAAAQPPLSFTNFSNPRPFSQGILDYANSQGFTHLTPVQAATIPHFLSHKDVAVQAVTGSGKTLAFLIPIVEMLLQQQQQRRRRRRQLRSLVLAPTRELAQQIYRVAVDLCAAAAASASSSEEEEQLLRPPLLWTGGGSSSSSTNRRPVTEDVQAFTAAQGCDIVIGTPGRVNDVLGRYQVVDCSELVCLVLDEADVLLNMGFSTTLSEILRVLPKMRRTALFSATQQSSSSISHLTDWMHRMGMRNPMWIDVTVAVKQKDETSQKQATPVSLTNYYIVCEQEEKLSRLVVFLQSHTEDKKIVFFLTCASVDFFGNCLQHVCPDLPIELLHGKMAQKRREKTMERYRSTPGSTLFCTDVAARGLDVSDITYVVQFDAPQNPAFFIHRAGRAGRAGRSGKSLVFVTRKEEAYVNLLEMRNVPLSPLPETEMCCPPEEEDDDDDHNESRRRDNAGVIRNAAGDVLDDILPKIRESVSKDRDLLEKGTRAYTSYIRAYKEHQCSFIFRFQTLDLGRLATAFCLLRLPKMPELREAIQKHKGKLPHFTPAGSELNIFAIPFLDKAREAARQKRLQEELAAGGKNAKQIKAEQKKAVKERKTKEKQQSKRRSRTTQMAEEWDDLAKEERLFKKLRRGKISQSEYDKCMEE